MSRNAYEILRAAFEAAGQGRVFRFWDTLDEAGRARLLEALSQIDLEELDALNRRFLPSGNAPAFDGNGLCGAPMIPAESHGGDAETWRRARAVGEDALRAGRVACFTVAGGQGTRLGCDGPKGVFPVTPVREKPLFQVFAEKILAARRRYGAAIPWLVMTSRANHAQTLAFFERNGYFGLGADSVFLFPQGMMPAVDRSGKILMEAPDAPAMSPDGHGGALRAIVRSGALARLRAAGADLISYFQVDNPLVRCADPDFIGWHLLKNSEMSSKAILKTDPAEKVGIFCLRGGETCVVEYSDLPRDLAALRRADGKLEFCAGSIAIHLFSLDFVGRMGGETRALPFHRAEKKVPFIDESGAKVVPASTNGVKYEMFVFDAVLSAKNPLVIETLREEEFSAVKNAEGVDSPETCRLAQTLQAARWLRGAGVRVPVDESGVPPFPIEISPLFADSQEALAAKVGALPPLDFSRPVYIE